MREKCTAAIFPAGEDALMRRVRGEFGEMPGMRLTMEQAMRLWALDRPTCSDILDSLVAACHAGLAVTQVPVAMRPRQFGRPSQGAWGSTVYLLRSMFALGLALMRRSRPAPGVTA